VIPSSQIAAYVYELIRVPRPLAGEALHILCKTTMKEKPVLKAESLLILEES